MIAIMATHATIVQAAAMAPIERLLSEDPCCDWLDSELSGVEETAGVEETIAGGDGVVRPCELFVV